jgi:hypothetical protein
MEILLLSYILHVIEETFSYQDLAYGIIYALHFLLSPWLGLCELCFIHIFGIMGLFVGICLFSYSILMSNIMLVNTFKLKKT